MESSFRRWTGRSAVAAIVTVALSGCMTVPKAYCDELSPRAQGWHPIDAPANARDILAVGNAQVGGRYLWHADAAGRLRACLYRSHHVLGARCGSALYGFERAGDHWTGGLIRIHVCHD